MSDSDVSFWSAVVPAKGNVEQALDQSPEMTSYLHITNVALAANPPDGPNTISMIVNGKEVVLATLAKGGALMHPLDVLLDSTATFANSGKAAVHLSGYITHAMMDEGQEFDEDDEDEDEDEDEEEDDEEEAPMAVPLKGKAIAAAKAARAPGGDDDDEGEEEDEDGEFEEGEEEEEEEDEDEDEDEERPGARASRRLQMALDGEGADDFEIDSDDIVGEVEEGEDEDEEDEDEELILGKPHPTKKRSGDDEVIVGKPHPSNKRAAAAATPGPAAKKVKTDVAKAPASAPPKMQKQQAEKGQKQQQQQQQEKAPKQQQEKGEKQPKQDKGAAAAQAGPSGDDVKGYEKALVDCLSKQPNKTMPVSSLGSTVKKPASVPAKLTAFIKARPTLFKHDEKGGTVSLLK